MPKRPGNLHYARVTLLLALLAVTGLTISWVRGDDQASVKPIRPAPQGAAKPVTSLGEADSLSGIVAKSALPQEVAAMPAPTLPWQLMPYTIDVVVHVDAGVPLALGRALREARQEHALKALGRVASPWQPPLAQSSKEGNPDSEGALGPAPKDNPANEVKPDKRYHVWLQNAFPGYRIIVREECLLTNSLGRPQVLAAYDDNHVREAFERGVRAAFRPVAKLTGSLGATAKSKLRGGLLLEGAPGQMAPQIGDFYSAVVRENTFQGEAKASPIPWAYARLETWVGGQVNFHLHAVSLKAFAPRRSGRSSILLVKSEAPGGQTLLRLEESSPGGKPLVGYEVQVRPVDGEQLTTVGFTDSAGEVTLSADAGVLLYVYIRHGEALLSRIPLLPGLKEIVTATARNDDERLLAEGYLAGLQDEVVDLIARRELTLTKAQLALERGKLEEADAQLKRYRSLLPASSLMLALDRREAQDRESAAARGRDARTGRQVARMFEDTRLLVRNAFREERVLEIEAELQKAKLSAKGDKNEGS